MALELDGHGNTASEATALESLLGPTRDRYFGAGYRAVRYSLTSVHAGLTEIEAVANVAYPARWSTGGDGLARSAHLSSVDAVILPVIVMESAALPSELRAAGRFRLSSIELRAGAHPWLTLDVVPVKLTADDAGAQRHLRAVSGNIRLNATLSRIDEQPETEGTIAPADGPSVYGGLFQTVDTRSTVRGLDVTRCELRASHVIASDGAFAPGAGVEACQWPAPTVVDYLVTMGQLTQAIVYASAGTTRSEAGPLWMRTMSIDVHESQPPLPSRFDTITRVLRDRVLERGGERIHDVLVESVASSGVRARSTLAYKEVSG